MFNTRNPQDHDFKTPPEYEYWHSFQDFDGEDVQVFGKKQLDLSHQIVTYTTKRVWKDNQTTTRIQLRFTPYDQLMRLLAQTSNCRPA